MIIDIFNELTWPHFKELNHVRGLSLNEQVTLYNQYLTELNHQRQCYIQQINWLECNKGARPKDRITITGFLLQEDLFDLEQEDGSKILITGYA